MTRKDVWIPVAVIGLGVAFATVSLLVRASRGNPWLIRRKLRLGALLLSLGWTAAGCSEGGSTTCYAPLPPEHVEFDAEFWSEVDARLVLDLSAGHALTGQIYRRTTTSFAYRLLAADQTERQRGELVALDGAFDAASEAFSLDLGAAVAPADYELVVYAGEVEADVVLDQVALTVLADE